MNTTFAKESVDLREKVEKAIMENRIKPVPPCTKEEALKFFKKSDMLFGREQEELLLRAMPLISGGFVREKIVYPTSLHWRKVLFTALPIKIRENIFYLLLRIISLEISLRIRR